MSRTTVTCKSDRNSNNTGRASPLTSIPRFLAEIAGRMILLVCPNWFRCPFTADEYVPGIETLAALDDELAQG